VKKCPFCSEDVQNDATKCRFCGEWFNASESIKEEPPVDRDDGLSPTKEKELASAYALTKVRRFGWAWIFLLTSLAQMSRMKPANAGEISYIASFFPILAVPFYFWLRMKIARLMVLRGTYQRRNWLPPLIALLASYALVNAIMIVCAMVLFGFKAV
jgi:hypothetical protein